MTIWQGKLKAHTAYNWYDWQVNGFIPYWKRYRYFQIRQNNGLLEAL